jgi:hypothetical protein
VTLLEVVNDNDGVFFSEKHLDKDASNITGTAGNQNQLDFTPSII